MSFIRSLFKRKKIETINSSTEEKSIQKLVDDKKSSISVFTKEQIEKNTKFYSITQSGRVLMTSPLVSNNPKDYQEGRAVEVMFTFEGMEPYFFYYFNEEYYYKTSNNIGLGGAYNHADAEKNRNNISQFLASVLISYLNIEYKIDLSTIPCNYSHNHTNTNTIIFVESLNEWYPIRHAMNEGEDGAKNKVERINDGKEKIENYISVYDLSPRDAEIIEYNNNQININLLLRNFYAYCINIGANKNTIEKSYSEIINRYDSPSYDSFNLIISKVNACNVEHDLVNKHAKFSSSDVESFLYMANAYSLRSAAFGQMLHGGITQEMADYFTGLNFKFAQEQTCQSEKFQILSMNSTYELVRYIDKKINLDGLNKYIACAIINKKQIDFPYENANFIEWEVIIDFLDYVSTIQVLTPSILNKFINENIKPNQAME